MHNVAEPVATRGRLRRVLGLQACLASYFLLARFYFPFPSTVEDSYIVFRYAAHFAAGHGLSWNVGSPHEQGITGLIWAALVGGLQRVSSIDPPHAAGYLGIGLGMITIVLVYFSLRTALEESERYLALVGVIVISVSAVFTRHAANGMETALCFAAFAGCIFLAMKMPIHRPAVAVALSASASGLSYLVRPDAAMFCFPVVIATLLFAAQRRRWQLALTAAGAALALLAIVNLLIGRYFTTTLPLAAYLKVSLLESLASPDTLARTWRWVSSYQLQFFGAMAGWLVVTALAGAAGLNSIHRRVLAVAAGVLVFYAYLFAVLPIMNFEMRYQAPLIVPVIFVGAVALARVSAALGAPRRGYRLALAAVCAVLALEGFSLSPGMKLTAREGVTQHAAFALLGERLHQLPGVTIASGEAGRLAYSSDARFIDLIGLNDSFIALNRTAPDYAALLERYLFTAGPPDVYARRGGSDDYADLCNFPNILGRYEYIGKVNGDWPEVFVLRDSKRSGQVRERLAGIITPPEPGYPHGCSPLMP